MPDDLRLAAPDAAYREAFGAMAREFHDAGEAGWPHGAREGDDLALRDLDAYARECANGALGRNLRDSYVPATLWWLWAGERLAGTLNLRHRLTDGLLATGGHIGYCIRPSARRKGYMARFLLLALEEARALGLDRALLTCDDANVASAGVVEKCGGVLEDVRPSDDHASGRVRRYWIAL